MEVNNKNIEFLINSLKCMLEKQEFPHIHLSGPISQDIEYVYKNIIEDIYTQNSMVLEVQVLDNNSESILINTINAFCSQKSVMSNSKIQKKIVIIHQHNEILTDSLVHYLEDRLVENQVIFLLLSSSFHVAPEYLLKKMVSFRIHPKKNLLRNNTLENYDEFYKIIDEDLSEINLMNKIVDWCDIHSKKIPCKIYEKWKEMFETAF